MDPARRVSWDFGWALAVGCFEGLDFVLLVLLLGAVPEEGAEWNEALDSSLSS